jgi:hypothetical protein
MLAIKSVRRQDFLLFALSRNDLPEIRVANRPHSKAFCSHFNVLAHTRYKTIWKCCMLRNLRAACAVFCLTQAADAQWRIR